MANQQPLKLEELVDFVLKHCVHNPISESESQNDSDEHLVDVKTTNNQLALNDKSENKIKSRFIELFGKYAVDINCSSVLITLPTIDVNVSLCASILSCILDNFDNLNKDDQSICITKFFAKILSEVKKRNGLNKYITPTLLWDKKELVADISDFKMSPNVVAYVMTYLNINIFIISANDILLYCMGKLYNIYKPNIVLFFDGTSYQTLSYKQNKIWNYKDDEPLKNFIKSNQPKIHIYQQNKNNAQLEFKIGDDNDIELIWANEGEQKKDNTETDQHIEQSSEKSVTKPSEKKIIPMDDKEIKQKVEPQKQEKSTKKHVKEEIKNIKHEHVQPETTEQVLDAVFYKKEKKVVHPPPSEMDDDSSDSDNSDESGESSESSDEKTKKPTSSKHETKKVKDKELTSEKLEKMTCIKLRQLAALHGIKLMTKQDGKAKQKTKQELIKELLN